MGSRRMDEGRGPRWMRALVALALLAAGVPGVGLLLAQPAAAAFQTTMEFSNGDDNITVGPNAGIYIDGSLDYDDFCRGEGVTDDFLYPASDVYIVPTGGFAGPLVDAGGNGPNTIVGTATGLYIGEPIAFTSPGGTLGAGVYDVIFDTCQDGIVDGEDAIFFEAITVEMPEGDLPPASGAIARIKAREREQFLFWTQMHENIALMFKVDKAAAVLECILMASPECLARMILTLADRDSGRAQLNNRVEDLVLGLILNVSKNHGAIWQDPPDGDFAHLPELVPVDRADVPAGGAVHDAMAALIDPLADEAMLTDAYLHAVERYQGAQAAGDADWALVQARAARDLSETMREHLASSNALAELRDVIADPANGVTEGYEDGRQFVARVQSSGFTGPERQRLMNAGMSVQDINDYEAELAGLGSLPVGDTGIVAQLDQLIAARAGAVADLAQSQADWDAVIDRILATGDIPVPVADAGGPYAATAGATVTLDATASTTPAGTTISGYDWDLDGDGEFDDASGASPEVGVPTTGTGIVSVRVTNDAGRQSVDHAIVDRTEAPTAAITSVNPARAATVTVGTPKTFSVTATSPTPDPLGYEWILDGTAVGTGETFTYAPAGADVGHHVLAVEVTASNGTSAHDAWRVTVTTIDSDGDGWTSIPDCDDTRADIHPGRFEQFGNGIDDDCDAGTPDAPPGGLTGAVWTWGEAQGTGLGTFADRNVPTVLPSLPSVVQIESTHAGGVAVLPDGQVRTWGQGFGSVGDGTQEVRRTPVSPLAVGGAEGSRLSGVGRVSSEHSGVIAVRSSDGSVIAWGHNANGQVGDRSNVTVRLYPVEVVTEDGTPFTGAVDVEQGQQTNFILKSDGTVWTVGVGVCHGTSPRPKTNYAVQATLFGDDVVQLEGGQGWVVARKADGTLVSCGSDLWQLGRGDDSQPAQAYETPMPMIGFGPGSRVVDISAGSSTGVALTEDGTVYMWGKNTNGEMNAAGVPHGHPVYEAIPVPLPAGAPVVAVDNDGAAHTIAVRADGTAVVWGANNFGAAGTGSFSPNPAVGFHTMNIPGHVVDGAVSNWNSLALVRPLVDPEWERPMQWLDVAAGDAVIGEAAGGFVPLALSHPAPDDLTIGWSFAGDTGTAVIPAGASSVDVPVAVDDDAVDEDDQLVAFSIESVSNGVRVERGTSMVTVVDDDAAPVVYIAGVEVAEGATSLTDASLVVTLSAASGRDVVVGYGTADGSAVAGQDYSAATGSIVIPAGQTTAEVHVAVVGDEVIEPHEDFRVSLVSPENASIGGGSATVSIVDDEPVVIEVSSPSVSEGDTGTTAATFEVTVTPPPAGTTVTLPWTIVPGTAEVPTDIEAASGVLTFDATTTSGSVIANVVADDVHEDLATEVFRLLPGAGTASDGRVVVASDPGVASIVDDDPLDGSPTVVAGPDVAGTEATAVAIDATVSDDGPVTTTWSTDAPGCAIADAAATATTVTCADDATAVLTITVDDGVNPAVSDSLTVSVTNVAPSLGAASYTGDSVQAAFTDPGNDTHQCTVTFGDGSAPVVVDPASSPCAAAHTFGPGTHTATVTVVDDDGGTATSSVTVDVRSGYDWDGFFQPVDNDAVNTVTAGRAIPIKFSLGGDHGLDIFAEGSPGSVPVACSTGTRLDAIEETVNPGGSSLTYDQGSGRYHYVWKTNRGWAGECRLLVLTLADGSEHTAMFRFR